MQCESKIWSGGSWKTTAGSPCPDADLVLCFGAPRAMEDGAAWEALRKAHPKARVVGGTTAGEILGLDVHDESVVAVAVRLEHTPIETHSVRIEKQEESEAAGRELASAFRREGLRALFVVSDGTHVNGTALVRAMRGIVGNDVSITGGLAGDGTEFKRTRVGVDTAPAEGVIAAVGFYGDRIQIGHGSKGGFETFGPVRRITRSVGNVLYELDGKPALPIYKRYLGDEAARLPSSGLLYPLDLERKEDGKHMVRAVLSICEETQSMAFFGDMPEGSRAVLMRGTHEMLVEGAEAAAEEAGEGQLSIIVSCVGRKLLMGQRIGDEVEAAVDVLKGTTVGFYSYGEIAPIEDGFADLHNETMTVTTLREI